MQRVVVNVQQQVGGHYSQKKSKHIRLC